MGSVGHTAQQSRKAAFHGPYMNLLDTLCHHKDFLQIQQRDEPDSKREYDRELVLRFLAMKRSYNVFKTPLASFLIEELVQHHQADTAELKRLEAMFKNTTSVVWQIWGPEACRKPAACGGRSAFSEPLWDATMVGVCEELEQAGNNRRRGELVGKAADIREAYKKLCADKTFEDNLKTNSRRNIQRRIAMLRGMLVEAAPPTRLDARRAFPNDIKRQLWAEPAARGRQLVCGLCNQIIHQVGDAEVDHVTPWSHGGATTASNAQLVHR
ncbi:hypothetical protein MNEG_7138 [Monoraphidium neglectum]|uniref:HNH domain-containing protein n=1 Tax=Monoraphidium neglectum TaxID=145388 RepID=A0A0D2JNU8_9CHLO|nr:hypothetical protein MNEG_7138 [Monoraphidium neglectum]KIZ00823.1 hypothetical protein MNEG_7138 [Monoraphidium neglectum]|eukprot:XP_013899842.1 hypothetical protein MNEG_7138 [Monoraphidium neglectum]